MPPLPEKLALATGTDCFHCGEPVPTGTHLSVEIAGSEQPMCCPGCQAVASLIAGSGLERFYQQRVAFNTRPTDTPSTAGERYAIYDDPELAATFTTTNTEGLVEATILVGGISCAACTWLIEQALSRVAGIERAVVNFQQSRLDVRLQPDLCRPSSVFILLEDLGYQPRPFKASAQRQMLAAQYRSELRRLAVAGLGMMQVGMFAIALHAGDLQGMEVQYQSLLRWVSLPVAACVVVYSAWPFFTSAWRHLRRGALVMDLPVALAIGLAFLASAWATATGTGQVYFDSVVMFTFLLLLARFLEQRARQRHLFTWQDAADSLPAVVTARRDGQWVTLPRTQLHRGASILVRAGETVPADAVVTCGESALREDTFNGEHLPRPVATGATIYAGTINIDSVLEAEVLGDYRDSRLAALQNSVEQAQRAKPQLAQVADRLAGWFVGAILLITAITAVVWWQRDPGQAFWIALSVLVISCPCALALATPAAITNAANALRASGVIVRGENALEALSRCSHVLFDKTGTLTQGTLSLARLETLGSLDADAVVAIAAALQRYSNHPVAHAFADIDPAPGLSEVEYRAGAGLRAASGTSHYHLGSVAFCRELYPLFPAPTDAQLYWIGLCSEREPLAWIGLNDALRPEAATVVKSLQQSGMEVQLLTGDSSAQGPLLAHALNIEAVYTGQSAQQKMQHVRDLQQRGSIVAMVGDGLNDAPVLGLSDASFAVAGATSLAQAQADFVIVEGGLDSLLHTWDKARQCRRVIRQNLCWALAYNFSAIPLAVCGWVPPWAAAIGMSLSSLLVVANSLRLNR